MSKFLKEDEITFEKHIAATIEHLKFVMKDQEETFGINEEYFELANIIVDLLRDLENISKKASSSGFEL